MTPELFPVPESLSPKLAWLKKHGLVTHHMPEFNGEDESPETGDTLYPWTCSAFKPHHPNFSIQAVIPGIGMTEEDAILDCARKNDITHWTLEQ